MASGDWMRRSLIRGLAAAALLSALPLGARPADGAATGYPPRDREARRRWALARMDEMASERLRCRERLKIPRLVRDCEEDFERRHRAYNEVYQEAIRD
jgi:hypothetical protein